ncbi:MAG: ABC transporter ATP-binding protein [Patescibacteria group bacterium]
MSVAPVIEATDLTFIRSNEPIVDKFSFAVERGQFVGVIGPNGGGKSTLVKLIVGLLRPSSGTIRVFGGDPTTTTVRRRLSYIPQRGGNLDAQFPATVEEIVASGLSRKSEEKINAVERALTTMGIESLRSRVIRDLSGGERQRMLIARALVCDPELLILDEPTDGLDPETREGLFKTLRTLRKEKHVTILCVSHDVHSIAKEADAALCLKHELVCHGEDACYLKKEDFRNVFHAKHDEITAHHTA